MKIKDAKLGKYEIQHDGNNYNVIENTGKIDKKGIEITKNHAYCTSVGSAIKKIVKLQVEGENDTYDLSEYVKAIQHETEKIEMKFSSRKN